MPPVMVSLITELSCDAASRGLSARPLHPFGFDYRNKSTSQWGRQVPLPRRSRRVIPHPGQGVCACGRTKGLSSGQTIGAVRTAVRSACCLPELRVANRLRRLYPLDTRFPSFPFGNLRAPKLARKPGNCNHCSCKKVFAFGSEQNDLPRGKPSAQPALPCTQLVVCLNSEPLTAYGGCIHRTRTFFPCPPKIPLLLFSKIRAKIIPLCG